MSRAPGLLLLPLIALLSSGCGPDIEIRKLYHQSPPRTVAVLPFTPPDEDKHTLEQVAFLRRRFQNYFSTLPFVLLDVDNVDRTLREHGIRTAEDLAKHEPEDVARLLGVEALVYGEIETIKNIAPLLAYYRSIGGKVKMVSGGKPVATYLTAEHTERSSGGPLIDSSQIIYAIMDQIRNHTNLAFINLGERWATEVVNRIPPPKNHVALKLHRPAVRSVTLKRSRAGTLLPGDRIDVVVLADAELRVTVDLGLGTPLSLSEVSAGRYQGSHIVQLGDEVDLTHVSAEGKDRFGLTGRRVAREGLKIAARPPGMPTKLAVEKQPAGVKLSWTPPLGAGTLTFEIYRAEGALSVGFVKLAETAEPHYVDKSAAQTRSYRYQVVSRRESGLAGYPSRAASWKGEKE